MEQLPLDLSSLPDPDAVNVRTRRAVVLAVVAAAGVAAWSFAPLGSARVEPPDQPATPSAPAVARQSLRGTLDRAAFSARVWESPPPPPPPPRPPAPMPPAVPEPPLKLQLVGIASSPSGTLPSEGRDRVAYIYDEAANRLHRRRIGEALGDLIVTTISGNSVELRHSADGERAVAPPARTLRLRVERTAILVPGLIKEPPSP